MQARNHLDILKRAGRVLVAVGVLDIGLMVYAILTRTSYSSSLNVFAVIAGIFLIRGSLRAAFLVRWFALFFSTTLVALIVVSPLIQPIDLTFTQVRISPGAFAAATAFFVLVLGLFVWLAHELGSEPVLEARRGIGLTAGRPLIPIGVGALLAVALGIVSTLVQRSDSGARAVQEARARLGDGYKYHVSSLNYSSGGGITRVSGVVTAWSAETVRNFPFEWQE